MAPIFMRAENYVNRKTRTPEYTATGYYISEKFDGQRAQWDPAGQQLISRYGNTINAPDWFLEHFRGLAEPVDGELFMGYSNWDLTGVFRSLKPDEDLWKRARFIMFDIADPNGGTFEERRRKLEGLYTSRGWDPVPQIEIIPVKIATGRQMIEEEFKRVIARGGEGIMLNSPHYLYHDGKTTGMLKYKNVMEEECVIVGYKMGNGKYAGMLGAFIAHPIEDGKPIKSREFSMSGMNDAVRSSYLKTHPIGTMLHYRCAEFTKDGKPRHPVYIGICRRPVVPLKELDEDFKIKPSPIPAPAPVPFKITLKPKPLFSY